MEGASASPSDSSSMDGGVSKYLANLPSRGLFSSTVISSNPGGMRVYVCDHDTSPPEDQLIKTNQMNILIRSLTLKKQKSDSSAKDVKGKATAESTKGKRTAERIGDGRASVKRANMTKNSESARREGSSTRAPEKDLQSLTVERLRALLKERGLSVKGKKDELIARLKGDRVDGES
ncbi:PREDICTED: uncharacterized protein LOC104592902 [Nelumbo nucifera]|uniref:SAP domain-containing protein n=2 Tax=Nelumbo nucifera TaxID=4432 RepID=A0A822YYD6_NELNU|nr:PREDICTED: uncharacterized protein LOC104592902 [Nelumbo nucifera]DAD34268.1 TPA_asm: hypothetical protein HUJ06_004908 [Nelumbo nucifera]